MKVYVIEEGEDYGWHEITKIFADREEAIKHIKVRWYERKGIELNTPDTTVNCWRVNKKHDYISLEEYDVI